MPSSSEKSTKTLPGNTSGSPKTKPKTTPRQGTKPEPTGKKDSEKETDTPAAAATTTRKSTTKQPAAKETKPAVARPTTRVRKPTPQQQFHIARARRRRLYERLWLGLIAVVLIVVVTVVIWQVIAKNEADARLARTHAAATSTALAHATATQTELNIVEPQTPPAVTGKTITTKDGLQYIDIKVGTGTAAKEGDTISVRYVGWNVTANCQVVDVCQFDSSYYENIQNKKDPAAVVQFQLVGPDQQGVIQGWVEGVTGMKAGGERRLIIPAALGYGSQAQSGGEQPIPANASLIFDITLVSIDNAATPTPTATASS